MEREDHISIWGGGAVGHMLAFLLSEHSSASLQIMGRNGPLSLESSLHWGDEAKSLRLTAREGFEPSLVLVALKAYDLTSAIEQHAPQLQSGTVIVLLSNGYIEPMVAPLRGQFPDLIWRKGVVTKGIRLDAEGHYRMGTQGAVTWGGGTFAPTPVELRCLSQLQPWGWSWSDTACDLRRRKWFFNCVLNTLTAAYRLPRNGDALRLFEADLEALAKESYALGKELWPDWKDVWESLWWDLRTLVLMTADNENSMARDFRLQRRTEAEVLSGCLSLIAQPQRYPLLRSFHERITGQRI